MKENFLKSALQNSIPVCAFVGGMLFFSQPAQAMGLTIVQGGSDNFMAWEAESYHSFFDPDGDNITWFERIDPS